MHWDGFKVSGTTFVSGIKGEFYLSAEISFEASLQKARKTRKASIAKTACSSYSSSAVPVSVPRISSAVTRFTNESLFRQKGVSDLLLQCNLLWCALWFQFGIISPSDILIERERTRPFRSSINPFENSRNHLH